MEVYLRQSQFGHNSIMLHKMKVAAQQFAEQFMSIQGQKTIFLTGAVFG